MATTCREMLDEIDDFFVTHWKDAEAHKLWTVLCALRGSDRVGFSKEFTTGPIRAAAFPRLSEFKERSLSRANVRFPVPISRTCPSPVFGGRWWTPVSNDPLDHHFIEHASSAARILGLKD